jgi:hypothetical protein
MSVEQLASIRDIPVFDGFGQETDEPPMLGWDDEGLHSLSALWRAVSENLIPFVGFQNAPSNATLLLKLHGSLGWFVLEEGNGDIGTREDMRHNTPYQFFRYPYQELLRLEGSGESADVDTLALGGQSDPATRTPQGALTRKAGALWLRPYLLYAIALKAHLNRISLDLLGTFGRLLSQAQYVLVIGYSWSDPHINDLLLGAVAQGCTLVNVGLHAKDERFHALWMQRFPTTYPVVAKRLYSLGGGAKRVLAEQEIVSLSEEIYRFDVVSSLNGTLPKELSLSYQLAPNRLNT